MIDSQFPATFYLCFQPPTERVQKNVHTRTSAARSCVEILCKYNFFSSVHPQLSAIFYLLIIEFAIFCLALFFPFIFAPFTALQRSIYEISLRCTMLSRRRSFPSPSQASFTFFPRGNASNPREIPQYDVNNVS
jgi:hypothetical protein